MVTSDHWPPSRPPAEVQRQMTPFELALSLVRRPRFAFFTDDRGVVYCEQVDHAKVVLAALGKTMGGKPQLYRNVLQWNGKEDPFKSELRELYDRGFVIEPFMAYMTPNAWGVVKSIKDVEDVRLGRKFRYICRAGSPEGYYDGKPDLLGEVHNETPARNRRPVQPFTEVLLTKLQGTPISRQDIVELYSEKLSEEELAYAPKWVRGKA